MALIEIKKDPSKNDLRWFGVIVALVFAVLGVVARFVWGTPTAANVLWIIGGAVFVIYYAIPPIRRLMFIGWMYLVFPIGWVVGHVLLGITYYLVLTPIGILRRTLAGDPMERKFDREGSTYWIERPPPAEASRYFRQF